LCRRPQPETVVVPHPGAGEPAARPVALLPPPHRLRLLTWHGRHVRRRPWSPADRTTFPGRGDPHTVSRPLLGTIRLSIGEIAHRTSTTRRMLRHWERLGLIQPAEVDPHTGYRRYAASQVGPLQEREGELVGPDRRCLDQPGPGAQPPAGLRGGDRKSV